MATNKANNYTSDQIQVLKGLEGVRKRPGMYIGSTDSRGLHHLIWEIFDNSVDEVLSDYANQIRVIIHKGNSIEVMDNGRGIPIGMHKTGVPTPQVVFCELHSGGKFDDSSYKVSGGLHGVGASVVNALSEWMEVTICRDGKIYTQRFEDGGKVIKKPKVVSDTSKRRGTTVHFKPDPSIFSTTLVDYKLCSQRIKETAFLTRGLKVELIDERTGQSESFKYETGILEYAKDLAGDKKALCDPIYLSGEFDVTPDEPNKDKKVIITAEAALAYTAKTYSEHILSYVNNVRTTDGGTHETGFKSGLTKAFNEHARMANLLKDKDPNLDGSDIRTGLTAVISVRIPDKILQFESQTKSKLGTAEAKSAVESIVSEKMKFFLSEKGEIANLLIGNAISAFKEREQIRKVRDDIREIKEKVSKPINMNGKLTPAQTRNPEINELFLVEGDSAGGSARQGRDRRFQAILPLRGKVINAEKISQQELLKNEEILSIIHAIGAGIGKDFNLNKCNYKKVVIMTDADTDGAHIQILLLTFFFRYMKPLIDDGRVYIALPPLYKIAYKNKVEYAWSDEELREKLQDGKQTNVQRFKGLGEMNLTQLWDTTMNPETRTLVRVNIEDFGEADNCINILMGDDVEPRREWIENNVSFENVDNFTLEDVEVLGDE